MALATKTMKRVFEHAILLILILTFISACASKLGAKTSNPINVRNIKSVSVLEKDDSIDIRIIADQLLTYTSVKQPYPLGLIFYLPDTKLNDARIDRVPANEWVSMINASESTDHGNTTRIEISLKKDIPFEVDDSENGLVISLFKKEESSVIEEDLSSSMEETKKTVISDKGVPKAASKTDELSDSDIILDKSPMMSVAETSEAEKTSANISDKISEINSEISNQPNMISSVYALTGENGLLVALQSDFPITEFETFTIKSSDGMPARIVFDLPGVQSPFKKEQSIQINGQWADKIRHYSHPDKVRLVVDTHDQYLTSYSANAVKNGLEILIEAAPVEKPVKLAKTGMPQPRKSIEDVKNGELSESAKIETIGSSESIEITAQPETARASADVYPIETTEFTEDVKISESDQPIETTESQEVLEVGETITPIQATEPPEVIEVSASSHPAETQEPSEIVEVAETNFPVQATEPPEITEVAEPSQPIESTETSDGVSFKFEEKKVDAQETAAKTARQADKIVEGKKSSFSQKNVSGKALVSRVDFQSKEAGKSEILIGTSKPVDYKLNKVNDKKVVLQLFETNLVEHQKRPLITTRFESAVDRILPIQRKGMKDTLISIELREMVEYDIKQTDSLLRLQFAASSIPPKTFEEAKLPPWKQIMAQTDPMTTEMAETGVTGISELSGDYDDILTIERSGRKKYTGEKVALDFYETDIKNVFRILREVGGKNFAIDKDVTGKVTMTLEKPVPWDQVLDLVLRMNQLGKVVDGDIIRIARMETITKEEQARQARIEAEAQAREQEKAVEPLYTEYLQINYSDAQTEILPHIQKVATGDRGSLSVDPRTNTIIMVDTIEKINHAKQIIRHLDKVTPQVIIETRIVEATNNFSKAVGIQWALEGGIQNDEERAGIGPQRAFDTLGGTWAYDAAVNLPVVDTGSIGFEFKRILGTPFELDARLGAMEELGEVRIVSAPKVLTLDNKKASIKQGREVPYSVVGENAMVDVEYKQADLLLEVTPHVTSDQRISLKVFITNNEVAETLPNGEPVIATKEAETELLINDGETVVIGGILQTSDDYVESKIPGVGNIPVLRWLFKSNSTEVRKNEMMIFLTPRILQLEQRGI